MRLLEPVDLDRQRPQLVGTPAVVARASGRRLELGDRHALDRAERQLQEALPERA